MRTVLRLQVKELKQHQPECRCYIVLTKCDLLDQLTPFASPRISEEEPQSDTGHLKVVTAGCGGSGGSESPGEGHASVKSQQQSLSPTSPFEREYSGDAFAASSGSDGVFPIPPPSPLGQLCRLTLNGSV